MLKSLSAFVPILVLAALSATPVTAKTGTIKRPSPEARP